MGSFIDKLKEALKGFKDEDDRSIGKNYEHKHNVQKLRAEMQEGMFKGLFYRDGNRLIISAPEVIIGNVDENGMLIEGGSVTIRAGEVNLQGVGENGSVNTCAASIRQTAQDRGIDGKEAVVWNKSEIVNQAASIVLESNNTDNVFYKEPEITDRGGIVIHSDSTLQLEACISAESCKSKVEASITELENKKNEIEDIVNEKEQNFEAIAKDLQTIIEKQEELSTDDQTVKANLKELKKLQYKFEFNSRALKEATDSWFDAISALAEVCRQKEALEAKKDTIVVGDDYKTNSTGASVSIVGERIDLLSEDGENNRRDNDGSGIGIYANEVEIASREKDQSLKKDGSVIISAKSLGFNTVSPTNLEENDNGTIKNGQFPVVGDIFIRSKNISVEAVDREIKDGNNEEKALAKDSSIVIRAEKMDFNTTDTEGKATGSVKVNSKEVRVTSLDSSDNGNQVSDGSNMLLLSENMFLGAKSSSDNKFLKPKTLQVVGDKIGLFACEALAAKSVDGQGKTKSLLQLTENSASISGSKTQVYGETTIHAKLEVKDKVTIPDATVDNLEVGKSMKTPNFTIGTKISKPVQAEKPNDNVDVKESKLDSGDKK